MFDLNKARFFLLVDLREFFFRFRVGGWKKKKVDWSFSELFFSFLEGFFVLFFFNIR